MNDESTNERDEVRMEVAIQTIKDVLYRFTETSEGNRSVYEVFGFAVQDLLREGLCPACINEAFTMAYSETDADATIHRDDEGSVYH